MEDFVSCSFDHCNRDINRVAHELARVAMESNLNCNWVDEPPRFILEHLVINKVRQMASLKKTSLIM